MKRLAETAEPPAAAVWNDDDDAAAAWHDDADSSLQVDVVNGKNRLKKLRKAEHETTLSGKVYEKRLREVFEKTTGSREKPNWALVDEEINTQKDDSKVLTKVARLNEKQSHLAAAREQRSNRGAGAGGKTLSNRAGGKNLPSGKIDITRLPNANKAEEQQSTVDCLQFHPNNEVLFTAGRDKTLR